MILPYQISATLKVIMKKLGFKKTYIDNAHKYSNMISSFVQYTICEAIEDGIIKKGDAVVFMETTIVLTINFMIIKY